MGKKLLYSVLIFLFFSPFSWADSVIRYTIEEPTSGQTDKRTAFVSNGKVRVVNTGGRIEPEAIFNSETGQLVLINHPNKSFINVNEKELTAMAGQLKSLFESVMSDLPFNNPYASNPDKKEVKHSGMQLKIAGISCELYEIRRYDKKESEVCIAKSNRLEISLNDYITLEKLYQTGDRLATTARETIGHQLGPIPEFGAGELGGLPVYIMSSTGTTKLELRVTNISSEPVSGDYFKIPTGYSQQGLPSLL